MRIVSPPSFKRPSQKPCPILCLNKAFVNFCCLLSIDHLSLTGSLTLHIRQPETEIPRAAFSAFMLSMSFSMFIAHRTASITKVTAAGTQPSSALIVAMVASGWAGSASLKPAMCRESVRSCVAPAWASFAARLSPVETRLSMRRPLCHSIRSAMLLRLVLNMTKVMERPMPTVTAFR